MNDDCDNDDESSRSSSSSAEKAEVSSELNKNRQRQRHHGRQYTQKFRLDWLKADRFKDWLTTASTSKKIVDSDRTEAELKNSAYCYYCKVIIKAKAFNIKQHYYSKKHEIAAKPFNVARRTTIESYCAPSNVPGLKVALARIVFFVAVHTSIRTVDHLTELIKSCFGDSKFSRIDLKRTKCTAIIRNLWGPYFEKAIVEDVGYQPYTLIIDESTNIST